MYVIEELNENNIEDYVRVNVLAWKQSYKGIVNDEYLNFINSEDQISEICNHMKESLNDKSKKNFILKVDNKPAGVLGIRNSKYENYTNCGELGSLYLLDEFKKKGYGKILFDKCVLELKKMGYKSMINGCLVSNPSNDFYKHMGGKLIDVIKFNVRNGQELDENIYYYDKI